MVEVKVFKGGSVATQDVDAGAFGAKVLGRTLKDAVVMYEANQRQGTVNGKPVHIMEYDVCDSMQACVGDSVAEIAVEHAQRLS